jgi:hypothetical protein
MFCEKGYFLGKYWKYLCLDAGYWSWKALIDEAPKQCFLLFEFGASDHVACHFHKCSIADVPQSSNNCHSGAAI